MSPRRVMYLVPAVLWAGVIYFLSSYEHPLQSPLVSTFTRIVEAVNVFRFDLAALERFMEASELNRRLTHLALYLVLGALVMLALRHTAARSAQSTQWMAVTICAVYGLSDEIHQMFVPGRSFQWMDLVFDILGGLLGMLLYRWLASDRARGGGGRVDPTTQIE